MSDIFSWYKVTRRVDDSYKVMGQIGIRIGGSDHRPLLYFPENNELHNNGLGVTEINTLGAHRWFVYKDALQKMD